MKILKVYNRVLELLQEKEVYRNNYYKLLVRIWWEQLKKMDKKDISAFDFLLLLKEGKFEHPESIMRARIKVQENYPELRGKTYVKRKIVEQDKVRKELGYN